MIEKWVYAFGGGTAEGRAGDRELLGGKGANLAEMSGIGLPVPPGFTITTEMCDRFYANGRTYPASLRPQVEAAMTRLAELTGRRFGDPTDPLLVSVRSGARASMPGMMDTVLNLGLNDATVEGLAKGSRDERFAWDSYRRFVEMYADVVLELEREPFQAIVEERMHRNGAGKDTDLTAADWRDVVRLYKEVVATKTGSAFPQDPSEQLWGAISAVFLSWASARAKTYRRLNDIPESWGTAVNVQAMVFGNAGTDSATGVAFTRNPSTGENALYGEFLMNAQGEDVVAGIRTPQPITERARIESGSAEPSLETLMPEAFEAFVDVADRLEGHYRDVQDLEFTIERGKLWMLQTRSGKRTARAALRVAVEMVGEGLIDRTEAVRRIDPASLDQLLHPSIDPTAERTVLATGLPASPGAAAGRIVFTSEAAETARGRGEKVILVRAETSPEDIVGMHAAEGILTTRGGMTSHAAVVARGMGKPCVCGVEGMRVDLRAKTLTVAGTTFSVGDFLTIDGGTGEVLEGECAMLPATPSDELRTVMGWADGRRRMRVRANAETPEDARVARTFGAEGIGLCRTEHMFFAPDRIVAMREMILADTQEGRRAALAKLLPMQRSDFRELFEIMAGLPVTIRLLDPPLHEFLPHSEDEIAEVAEASGVPAERLRRRIETLREQNPMLGHRGCRLAISYPEIAEMQARAIFEAAVEAGRRTGESVVPEIMVPLVGLKRELEIVREQIEAVAAAVAEETGATLDYLIGTMIELPRAALRAGEIAEGAEFFSFGTNDLTQTTFGISRDDAGSFLDLYRERDIVERDPFVSLDVAGVGELVEIAAERGRRTRPGIKLGICGEHGGDPASIRFCEEVGLDYVSCSPFRIPIARLAAAQATKEGTGYTNTSENSTVAHP